MGDNITRSNVSQGFKASQTITNNSSGAMNPSKFATWFENKMDDAGNKSMQVGQDYNEESAAEGNVTNSGTTEEAREGKDGRVKIVEVTEKPENGLATKDGGREETQGEYYLICSLSKPICFYIYFFEVVLSGPNYLL